MKSIVELIVVYQRDSSFPTMYTTSLQAVNIAASSWCKNSGNFAAAAAALQDIFS